MDAEYWRLGTIAELGGTARPVASLIWAIGELILGANAPVWMYGAGPASRASSTATATSATSDRRSIIVDRQWGATMVLTEPDAGSDVGAGRTKATQNDDGTWNIEGVKRFITSAERDLHREHHPPGAGPPGGVEGVGGPGTKGLSLFLVPKFHFDPETGELRRAQRRLRHQRRAQDGHQGLQHLRGHLRDGSRRGEPAGLAARRGARRHRPDVPGHRVRPDDGRHQGHRHAVDRLPQRAGVRQGARPGRRPHPGRRTRPRRGSRSPTTPTYAAR